MSKFLSAENFMVATGEYEILPFRFEHISEFDVVVTNAVGEFTFLTKTKLNQLVAKTLPPLDPDYVNLRSKHILREKNDLAPLELLALKTRTKLQHLGNFTNLHAFVVTLRCDHSCQYCQVSRQSEDKSAFDMSVETANRSIDLMFRSPNPAIKIEFQGGEPLLNFDLIRHIVIESEKRNQTEGRDLQIVIATTLSLATTEILEFCRDHNIYLSASLDGPADLHNKNRPRPGRDSHERFIDGLRKARNIVGFDSVSALMTTTYSSLDRVRDIIDEYLRNDFDSIFLRHLSPYGFAIKTKNYQSYNVDKWLDFYREGMDYIISLNKQGIRFVELYSSIILTKMLSADDPGFVDLMNPAGA